MNGQACVSMRMKNYRVLIKSIVMIFATGIFLLGGGVIFPSSQTRTVSAQTVHPCLNRVNIPIDELHWLYVPETASELYTEEEYYFLAGELIKANVVDGSMCPSGGLMQSGYANACGMATAMPAVIVIQNMFNEPILQAWKDVGVPPVLLKQMIQIESQFWPSLTIFEEAYLEEYGFGRMTIYGMQNALEWNRDLYTKACMNLPPGACAPDSDIAFQILASMVNTCETCQYGIDIESATRSVDYLAEVLLAHCYQTAQLIFNATGWYSSLVVDYATIWKLTMMDYTSGPTCVFDTVVNTFDVTEGPMNWSDISANVNGDNCTRGLEYANRVTARYFDFPPD